MEYNLLKPWLTLDPWQKETLNCKKIKNICIVSGRQCGKSTVVSILTAETAVKSPNEFILIGSGVIDQAELLFRKIKTYMNEKHKKMIKGRTTLGFMELTNGSKILCVPIGDTGASMRGYTATLVVIDEAALVPDRAWEAIEPVISVSKGRVVLLSTPQGKQGFFYNAYKNEEYFVKQVSARDCPRHSKEFLDAKQEELTPVAFATEYLGEFIDDYNRKFTEEWVEKVCILTKETHILKKRKYVLGIDVGGGVGLGETTFEGFDATNKEDVFQILNIFDNKIGGPDIERQITNLKNKYYYNRKTIGFDSGGIGLGVFQYLLRNSDLKRCMVDLNNASRSVNSEGKQKKLLKEEMYDLVEEMGWRGELRCFNDDAIKQSFRSIQIDRKKSGDIRYWGTYSHIVEGIIRAAWLAKAQSLSISKFYQNIY